MNEVVQNEFLNRYIEQNDKLVKYMTKMTDSLESINDKNVLHTDKLDENNKLAKESVDSFKLTVNQFNKQFRYINIYMLLLIIAIIILAGVEKAAKLYDLIRFVN